MKDWEVDEWNEREIRTTSGEMERLKLKKSVKPHQREGKGSEKTKKCSLATRSPCF